MSANEKDSRAEQKAVPAGTTMTVEGADMASWIGADIEIKAQRGVGYYLEVKS